MSSDYIWPLSKSSIPNEINTSFGPHINRNRWAFHDGIDLPAETDTKVYAMRGETARFAGKRGQDGYSSRHVVLEVDDADDGLMYLIPLHLDSIGGAVAPGANVVQGQEMGTVGDDGATYPHLRIEFLQGTPDPKAQTTRHPLSYLPYSDTANFTAPVADRSNRFESRMGRSDQAHEPTRRQHGPNLRASVAGGRSAIRSAVDCAHTGRWVRRGDRIALLGISL